jgi:hypothetical protein
MSIDNHEQPSDLATIAEMVGEKELTILPIDEAEEALALNQHYKMRTLLLRAALRREQEINKELKAKLMLAEKGVEEVREEIARLSNPKTEEAASKVGRAH